MFRKLAVGVVISAALAARLAAEAFTFAALGCMPYGLPVTAPSFERLIDEINRQQPAFTVHCGDIKAGGGPISDAYLETIESYFNTFDGPLVFTPGDNEWTDVHRSSVGGLDPLVWLQKIRDRFFAREQSLGRTTMALETQRQDPEHAFMVENARWERGGVIFATLHVVGSNNNDLADQPGAVAEFAARDAANQVWLRETFALAKAQDAPGVALFWQANTFSEDYGRSGRRSGFAAFLTVLEQEVRDYGKPVLLVHADEHKYRLNVGVRLDDASEPIPNLTRLQTFGASDFHGVLVVVNPAHPEVFLPGPLLVPGNRLPTSWSLDPQRRRGER